MRGARRGPARRWRSIGRWSTCPARVRFAPAAVRDLACPRSASEWPAWAGDGATLHQAGEDAGEGGWASCLDLPQFLFAFEPARPPAAEAGWAEGWMAWGMAIDGLLAWPVEQFARPAWMRYAAYPRLGTPDPWAGLGAESVAEGTVADGWMMREGVATTLAQGPAVVYASLAHLRERRVRNPALDALRDRGLIPPGASFGSWSRAVDPGPGPVPGSGVAGQLRASLESYIAGGGDREASLRHELSRGCEAAGVPLAGGPWGGPATELLLSPWAVAAVPRACAVQAIRLAGPAGEATARFAAPTTTADLGPG